MTIDEAWEKRLSLLEKASKLSEEVKSADRDRFPASSSTKISTWFAAVTSHYEYLAVADRMNAARWEADTIWHDAVVSAKGNVRVEWIARGDNWACKLETGEVFEP